MLYSTLVNFVIIIIIIVVFVVVVAWIITFSPVIFFLDVQGKKILGVSCSTNNAAEYNLQRVQVGQQYKYICTCKGQSSLFSANPMWCKVHYWECPLTT